MKPPGKRPAEANFSLYSTVSGMKSVPGTASCAEQTVAKSMVFPMRTITAPSACLASFPVSMLISLPSANVMVFVTTFIIISLK